MYRLSSLGCVALAGLVVLAGCASQHGHFGHPMKHEGQKALTVAEVLANTDQYKGQEICVSGTVVALCEHSGCWIKIADKKGDDTLLIKCIFAKEGSRIPPEAEGHKAVVQGTLLMTEVSEARRRHVAEERGASAEEIAKIVGPKTRLELACLAATVEGVKPAEPRPCEHEKH